MLESLCDLVKRYGKTCAVGLVEERNNILKVACFLQCWLKERYKSFIVANADNPIRVSYMGDASPSQSRCWRKHTIGNTDYNHMNRETVEWYVTRATVSTFNEDIEEIRVLLQEPRVVMDKDCIGSRTPAAGHRQPVAFSGSWQSFAASLRIKANRS